MNKKIVGAIAVFATTIAVATFALTTNEAQQEEQNVEATCLVPGPTDGTPIESTCPDTKIECHWEVHYCDEWFDAPTDCAKLGPANPSTNYGTVTWENYYCGCDMKCHPKGECKNGNKSDMVQQKCSAKYGWPECPKDAFTCYWKDANDSNFSCPTPKCCGGWCDLWDDCK